MTHTREEIEAATDNELRVMIAEARGWRWYTRRQNFFSEKAPGARVLANPDLLGETIEYFVPASEDMPLAPNPYVFLPDWPGDIRAAWELVEEHPHYFLLVRSNESKFRPAPWLKEMVWRCRFYAPEKFEGEADTAPRAICRAYLLARLAERGEGE